MFSAAIKTAAAAGGYQISRSLRFNSADSAYLNRTPASASNRKTYTFSAWIKPAGVPGNYLNIFLAQSGGTYGYFSFNSSNNLEFVSTGDGSTITTSAVYRDFSAWYHVMVAVDTTQATSSNRIKIYVNGTQVTALSVATYPAQNSDTQFNTTLPHFLGSNSTPGNFFIGYMTEVNFIDGQALTPSSFGQTNAQTGVWEPIPYNGSYGTNGFYLNFSDNSNTTAATLGKDYSGNGNNWTPNNFSVSAGAGNDSLVDTPTPYGVDTGAGGEVRGNYCVWNPLAKGSDATLANGNLDVSFGSAGSTTQQSATLGMSSGKWYWEVTITASSASPTFAVVGITTKQFGDSEYPGYTSTSWGYRGSDGQKWTNTSGSSYGASYTTNDVIGIAFDADAGTLTFYKNGTSQGTAYSSLAAGTYFPAIGDQSSSNTFTAATNFGQRPFAYTAPSGYKALCTQNLPTPTIGATSTTQANDYFNILLWTANGGTQTVSGLGFQPDFVWHKPYGVTADHALLNAVVGSSGRLASNTTAAEVTNANFQTAFTSDGWSMGTDNFGSGRLLVTWAWKANGSGSSNTAGSITSTVSANTTSGFSIVTYTGTGVAGTIGHGLGVAPSMIIVKSRTGSPDVPSWRVYHVSLGATKYIELNSTGAATTYGDWNDTAPTSTVFSVGAPTFTPNNQNGINYVAYCFAEIAGYSKFGSYTGNGSSDGPFIFTGFKPAYVVMKCSSTTGGWVIRDYKRGPYNVQTGELAAQSSDAEATPGQPLDFLSNGFKLRNADSWYNVNGNTYIFMAFAENPFKYSLAR